MPQAARKQNKPSARAARAPQTRSTQANPRPILYEPKVKRVRIQFFEVAPGRSGDLQKGKTHSLTYYQVGMNEAAQIIKGAFAKFAPQQQT